MGMEIVVISTRHFGTTICQSADHCPSTCIPKATDFTSVGTVRSVACMVGVVVDIIGNKRSAKMTRKGYIFQFLHEDSGSQLPDLAVPKGSDESLSGDSFGMQLHSFKSTFPSGSVRNRGDVQWEHWQVGGRKGARKWRKAEEW